MSRLQRGDGRIDVAFAVRAGRTRLTDLYQTAPCKVLQPEEEPGEPAGAVFLTTSGGLAGGDRISLSVAVGEDAAARISTQAAEKIYGAAAGDAPTRITQTLTVAPGGRLEWLPQETILFDGALLDRDTTAEVAPGAALLACDMTVLGRIARGEDFTRGVWGERWRIRRAGRIVWQDAGRLAGGDPARDAVAGFAGRRAIGTVIYVADDAAAHLDLARDLLAAADAFGGASVVNGLLLVRCLATEAQTVRRAVMTVIAGLRKHVFDLSPRLPRVWYV